MDPIEQTTSPKGQRVLRAVDRWKAGKPWLWVGLVEQLLGDVAETVENLRDPWIETGKKSDFDPHAWVLLYRRHKQVQRAALDFVERVLFAAQALGLYAEAERVATELAEVRALQEQVAATPGPMPSGADVREPAETWPYPRAAACTVSTAAIFRCNSDAGGIGNIDADPLFIDADGPDNTRVRTMMICAWDLAHSASTDYHLCRRRRFRRRRQYKLGYRLR